MFPLLIYHIHNQHYPAKSYGINDCEGAVFTMSMAKVQEMLLEVRPGQEVVDLMETVNR
jgi:hypothetical protein